MTCRLRSAMLRARLDSAALSAAVGVDVKTVNRWLAGRVPRQRTRLAVAVVLGETEADLWPQSRPDQAPGGLHLRRLSPHGIFASLADQFEQIWQTVTPYPAGAV